MAKKKQTQQPKSPKMVEQQVTHPNAENTPVTNNEENTAEKLSNLKCLNAMLVNETAMKRQEIGALLEDKKSLEAQLNRFNSVVDSLRSELARVTEDRDDLESKKCEGDLEIEKLKTMVDDLMGVVERKNVELENGVRMKNEEVKELGRNLVEAKANEKSLLEKLDELMSDYETVTKALRESEEKAVGMSVKCEGLRGEVEGLRNVNLEKEGQIGHLGDGVCVLSGENAGLRKVNSELEGQISNLDKLVCGLRKEVERVSGEKEIVLRDNEGLMTVNSELEGQMTSLDKLVCGLRKEVDRFSGEKEVVSKDNERLKKVNSELDGEVSSFSKEVCGLNADVLSLREAVEMWQVKFFELEKGKLDVVEELEGLKRELGVLLEEKRVKEEMIEGLIGEKSINLLRLGELEKVVECLQKVNAEIVEEKNMLEVVKTRQEGKVRELQSEVDEIRGNVLLIQESNKDQLESNKKLLSEIDDHKSVLDQVVKERDDVKKTLEEEKMNGVKLQVKVSEISLKMEETAKVIEELRGTSGTLVADKKELENSYTKMAEEKSSIEKNYVKAKDTIAELAGSLKAKSEMLQSALVMLRNTVVQLSVENKEAENEGITVNDRDLNEEMKPFMTEVHSMWEKVLEMKRETEQLKFCVMDAKRKKSFWTLVSSATTILAVVASFAYAKGFR